MTKEKEREIADMNYALGKSMGFRIAKKRYLKEINRLIKEYNEVINEQDRRISQVRFKLLDTFRPIHQIIEELKDKPLKKPKASLNQD